MMPVTPPSRADGTFTDNKGAGLSTSDILAEGGAQFDVVLDGTSGGQLVVPGGHMLLIAEYTREGDDLILTGPDGTKVLIQDFFGTGNPPDLVTEGGARISPEIASALAGSLAPGQYAQAEPSGAANQPIGTVDTATGSVWVLRADGSRVELQPGDPVFQGDVLETGEDGSTGLVFIDDTVFSLDSDGRMVLDEMIFDPTTGEGESAFTVVQGVFSFVSGQVVKSGDEAMVVNTPVATIGIRGTQVAVKAGAEGEENIITLLAEEDGTTGEIVITNAGGSQVLNVANQSSTITSYFEAPAAPVTLSQQQVDTLYGDSLSVLPDPTDYSFTGSQQDTGGGGQTGGGGEAGGEDGGEEGTGEEGAGDEEDELLEAVDGEATEEEILEEAVDDAAAQAAEQGVDEDAVAAAEAAAEIAFQEALADGEDAVAAGEQAFLETLEEGAGADDVIATAAGEGEGGDTGGFGDGDGFGTGFGGDDGFGGGDDGGLGGGLTGGDTGGDLPGVGSGTTTEAPPPFVPPPPTAQTPVVVAFDSTGDEDSSIQINATAFTTDVDGAEVLSVRLVGLPDGAVPSFGTQLADGSYDVTGGLSNLTIQPPENFSGDFELTLVATATEVTGDTATKSQSFTMSVLPVADVPDLAVAPAAGSEDAAIALSIAPELIDADGSETLSVTIAGIPDGATIHIGTFDILFDPQSTDPSDNVLLINDVTAADLAGLQITPPENFSGQFTLDIGAHSVDTATIDGQGVTDLASQVAQILVDVDAVADTPVVTIQDATITTDEDTAIDLGIDGALADTDGSEALTITIEGIPQGAVLSSDLGTIEYDENGLAVLTPDQLAGLQITPPPNSDADFSLAVTATATETSNADAADTATLALQVNVTAVADTPVVTIQDAAITTDEDAAIDLNIAAALQDTDGSEALIITIEGIPQGAVLSSDLGTFEYDENGLAVLTPDQLAGLQITPPADSDADFSLAVTATATETANADAVTTAVQTIQVDVTAVADTPVVTIQDATITTDEDIGVALNIGAALSDAGGSETLSITIDNIPDGAVLSAGMSTRQDNPDGTFNITLTPAELQGLTLTPPLNSDADFSLAVTATATETSNADAATTAVQTIQVDVTAVADVPTVTVTDVAGSENQPIALAITTALVDTDGSETLSVTITGIPAGAELADGVGNPITVLNGTVTFTDAASDYIAGLTIKPATGADFNLGVTSVATEAVGGDTADAVDSFLVNVTGVADVPTLTVTPAGGDEDAGIDLDITAQLGDTDGSEELSITISDIPQGAVLASGGVAIAIVAGMAALTQDQLQNLTITPPLNSNDDFTLDVEITATETDGSGSASVSENLVVTVTGVADQPTVNVSPVSGEVDETVALDITAALVDTDGSETLSVTIDNIPDGAVLSAGMGTAVDNGNGTFKVTLDPTELQGLTLTPPSGDDADFTLTVTGMATEDDGDTAATVVNLNVNVTDGDTPVVTVADAAGLEDTAIALDIMATLADGTTGVSHALFILEEGTDSVLKVNPDGSITQIVTQDEIKALTGENDADMDDRGIAIDAVGNVYFTEMDSDAILMKPADGGPLQIVVTEAEIAVLTGADGANPKALTIGPDGKIYVADDTSDSTISFDPATSQLDLVASESDLEAVSGISSVDLDGGIVINADGKLFVASDGSPDAIFEIDTASGDVSTLAQGTPFTDLDVYMALAPNGDIIVADDGTDTIYRVDANDGTVTTFLSEAQLESLVGHEVDLEGGIAFDQFGNFYVAEENSDDVFRWPVDDLAAGTIDTSAGALFVSENDIRDAIGGGADLEGGIAFQGLGDGEILSISISDIPDGAVLSAGMGSAEDNGDGTFSVTLTPEQLEGLTITPPEDSDDDFTLTVTATASDAQGNTTATTASLNVDVTGVADTPTLSADLGAFSINTEAGPYADLVAAHDPVGHWEFNETSGTGADDAAATDNDGVYQNGVTLGLPGVTGAGSSELRWP